MVIWLNDNNIKYVHMPKLGGRRRKLKEIDESLIQGWKHISFRNYAGYTLTDEYNEGINDLILIAKNQNVCYFCSECLPWRCHRSIVSNTLVLQGINVFHIMSESKVERHEIGKYGAIPKMVNNMVIYPKLEVMNK